MKFKEKFQIMVDAVEDNLQMPYRGQTYDTIVKQISEKTFVSKDSIASSFSFITNMSIGDYVKLRKLEAVLTYMKENEKCELGEAAFAYGYSERSSFERAFKRSYGVTPASVLRGENAVALIRPLTIRDVIEEEIMGTDSCLEQTGSLPEKDGSLQFDLTKEFDRDTVRAITDCQSIFGLTVEQVLVVYSLLKEKSRESLLTSCMSAEGLSPFRTINDYNDEELSCLFLTVNYHLSLDEAKLIVEDANQLGIAVKDISEEYLVIAEKHNVGGLLLSELPYSVFINNRDLYEKLLKESGTEAYDRDLGDVCGQLAFIFYKSELEKPSKDTIKRMRVAIDNIQMPFERYDIFFIAEQHEKASESDYQAYYNLLFNEMIRFGTHLSFERYQEIKRQSKQYGFNSVVEMIEMAEGFVAEYTAEEAIEVFNKRKERTELKEKYNLPGEESVKFAQSLVNDYVTEEEAFSLMSKLYGENRGDSVLDKLSILYSINNKFPLKEAEKWIARDAQHTFTGKDYPYFDLNRSWFNCREEEHCDLFPYSWYVEAKGCFNPHDLFYKHELFFTLCAMMHERFPDIKEAAAFMKSLAEMITSYDDFPPEAIERIGAEELRLPSVMDPGKVYSIYRANYSDKPLHSLNKEDVNVIWEAAYYDAPADDIQAIKNMIKHEQKGTRVPMPL